MLSSDVKYIFSNISNKKKNVYTKIPTLNTMRQYVSITKKLGFNYEEGVGRSNQKTLSLKRIDGTIIGELKNMRYPGNSSKAMQIVKDKIAAEKLLKQSNVGCTNSMVYSSQNLMEAKKDFFSTDPARLVVLKPIDMSGGKGVNVKVSKKNFEYFWKDTVDTIKSSSKKDVDLIVQDYIEGFEARAVVIQGKLISIVARIPAYVIGNGKDSISNLVKIKNRHRKKCAHLQKRPIVLDNKKLKYLEYQNIDFESIPKKGEYILLSSLSNIGNGGEMVDISYDVCSEIKNTALKSIAAIPGLYSGGVDLIMKSFEDKEPKVIEINAWPMLQSTIYPTYGKSHNPQEYFLNSFYALDQFINSPEETYKIDESSQYIRTLFEFQQLKNKLHSEQIINNFIEI